GKAVSDNIDMVIGMGGDGILHHVAQPLVGTATTLGVIPCGTANVLARQLGVPVRATGAAKALAAGPQVIDAPVLEITGNGPLGPIHRFSLFSFGVGVDAEIVAAAEADPLRKRDLGPVHYATTAIGVVRRDISRRVGGLRVGAGDRSGVGIGVMAQFRDSYTYFGAMPMRLAATPPNPMNVLIVEELKARRTLGLLRATLGSGGLDSAKGFTVWTGVEQFEVAADSPSPMQADGELLGSMSAIVARFRPQALRIAIPAREG
ncbi:MAG: diacylglycerol kinase family protein, partial [Acidimicrobiia bacterium]|nr:diacylglycerol kinase family protein [Acidimicrobiia bacterium]